MKARYDTQAIRESVPIVQALGMLDVTVGSNGRTRCPIPGCTPSPNSPSTEFSYTNTVWHCFRCVRGGDVFGLIQAVLKVDFIGAMKFLQDRGIDLKKYDVTPRLSLRAFLKDRCDSAWEQWAEESASIKYEHDEKIKQIKALKQVGDIDELDAAMLVSMADEEADRKWYDLDIVGTGRVVDEFRKELKHAQEYLPRPVERDQDPGNDERIHA